MSPHLPWIQDSPEKFWMLCGNWQTGNHHGSSYSRNGICPESGELGGVYGRWRNCRRSSFQRIFHLPKESENDGISTHDRFRLFHLKEVRGKKHFDPNLISTNCSAAKQLLLFTPCPVTRFAMHRNHALHDFAPQFSISLKLHLTFLQYCAKV